MANISHKNNELLIIFKVSNNAIFEVSYNRCGSNELPYFTTSATLYTPNHRGIECCGQCQERALPKGELAYDFYKKWDKKHLHGLNKEHIDELNNDLDVLKKCGYPYIEAEDSHEEFFRHWEENDLIINKPRKAKNIKWDTDGASYKECNLPRSAVIPFYMAEDDIADYLSNKFGFCVFSFTADPILHPAHG